MKNELSFFVTGAGNKTRRNLKHKNIFGHKLSVKRQKVNFMNLTFHSLVYGNGSKMVKMML